MAAALVLLLFSCMAMAFAAVVLFIIIKKKKKGGTTGGGGVATGPAAGDGPAPEFKTSNYNGKELLSSSVSAVKGLSGNADSSVYGDIPFAVPDGAPGVATSMKQKNRKYSRGDVKKMLAVSLDDSWPALKKHFGFEDWQKERVLALFIGQATKESTVRVDIETGTAKGYGKDSAHAYGPLQTAVTAFKGSAEQYGYMAEKNVPEMKWYE